MFDEWFYEWEEKSGGRRWRDGVFYNPPEWTLHVLTPAWLSRSLLQPSILSIRSGICVPTGNPGGAGSFQSRIPLLLLLNQVVELGSSGHGPHSPYMVLEGKYETCGGSSTF